MIDVRDEWTQKFVLEFSSLIRSPEEEPSMNGFKSFVFLMCHLMADFGANIYVPFFTYLPKMPIL